MFAAYVLIIDITDRITVRNYHIFFTGIFQERHNRIECCQSVRIFRSIEKRRKNKQTVMFSWKIPRLTCAEVIDQRLVVTLGEYTDFVDTRIFEKIRCINCCCTTWSTYHICTELDNSCCLGMSILSIRNTATKIQISCSVAVYKYSRIKEPLHVTVGSLLCNKCMTDRIRPWTCRTVSRQNADTAGIICKI